MPPPSEMCHKLTAWDYRAERCSELDAPGMPSPGSVCRTHFAWLGSMCRTHFAWLGSVPVYPRCSGRHALRTRLQQLGYDLTPTELDDVFKRFKNVADKKKVRLPTLPLAAPLTAPAPALPIPVRTIVAVLMSPFFWVGSGRFELALGWHWVGLVGITDCGGRRPRGPAVRRTLPARGHLASHGPPGTPRYTPVCTSPAPPAGIPQARPP